MTCARCRVRPALFIRWQPRRGQRAALIVKADADHDLCLRCYRSEREKQRSRDLAARTRGGWSA